MLGDDDGIVLKSYKSTLSKKWRTKSAATGALLWSIADIFVCSCNAFSWSASVSGVIVIGILEIKIYMRIR